MTGVKNMDFYCKEKPHNKRWESGQSILHRQQPETKKAPHKQQDYALENSYGDLRYLKKDEKTGQDREGFSLEAKEAAGTPTHTEKEKRLDRATMKKVSHGSKKTLFSSELPLRNQALFYEMSGSKKSDAFLKCMKALIRRQGHQTLRDAFGFLEQEPEQLELKTLKSQQQRISPDTKTEYPHELSLEEKTGRRMLMTEEHVAHPQELTLEEFAATNKRMDQLSERLRKKEAKERQLCSELQSMLARRSEEQHSAKQLLSDSPKHTQEESEKQSHSKSKNSSDNRRQNMQFSSQDTAQAEPGETEAEETDSHAKPLIES